LEVQGLYFRWFLSGIFCGYITNNIVIVVYSMCEHRPVALVYLGVKTPGRGGYWPEHNMSVQWSVLGALERLDVRLLS
jgi:hypothetical protein